jgi:uncharacterized damage-inducible protein DinB
MRLVDALLPEFDREMSSVRNMLERAPDARFAWKPHEKSFSLGSLVTHMATLPAWATETLDQTGFDIGDAPAQVALSSTQLVLATFDGNVARARASLIEKSNEELLTMWTLTRHGAVLFSMPKAVALRSYVLSHLIHHRGQLSVYLRCLDIPVPSVYGPSADERAS